MLISIIMGYAFGLLIEKFKGTRLSKLFLVLSVVVNIGMLGYFKYADFFIENFNAATGLSISLLNIALPIGISFYTFQILSYTIDVYRGDVKAQKNIISLGAYISLFPQLIAGPIVRYHDVAEQLENRKHSLNKSAEGVRRFIIGLSKKVIIANTLGELCADFAASSDRSVLYYWLYAVSFALQIYFDFSGYSDMAIGLGKLFGFDFMENFNYPFISNSITEFWRRWHMSLGRWFRDYVYIPLGGNRVSKLRHIFNILIVWLLTGFWHGAEWNFVVWGLYFAVFLVIEKFFLSPFLKKYRAAGHIYTLFLVLISFVIFNAANMSEAVFHIASMFGLTGEPLISAEGLYYLKSYAVVLIIAVIGATPLASKTINAVKKRDIDGKIINIAEPILLAILLIIVTGYLVDGSFNPFLYFRF